MTFFGEVVTLPSSLALLLVMFRCSAVLAFALSFGPMRLAARVQLAVTICMTLAIYPIVEDRVARHEEPDIAFFGDSLANIGIGATLGMMLRSFVFCLQIAGSIAGQTTSLSQIIASADMDPQPAIGHVLTIAALTLAMIYGLHVDLLRFIAASFLWSNDLTTAGFAQLAQIAVTQLADAFQLAFALVAPFFLVALLYNVTLGVVNRAMPQLMVSFVGAPVISGLALVLLALSVPVVLLAWHEAFQQFLAEAINVNG